MLSRRASGFCTGGNCRERTRRAGQTREEELEHGGQASKGETLNPKLEHEEAPLGLACCRPVARRVMRCDDMLTPSPKFLGFGFKPPSPMWPLSSNTITLMNSCVPPQRLSSKSSTRFLRCQHIGKLNEGCICTLRGDTASRYSVPRNYSIDTEAHAPLAKAPPDVGHFFISPVAPAVMSCRRDSLEAAVRAGSFLYVQHSLLSDTNPREGAYLQVRGGKGESGLLVEEGSESRQGKGR